MFPQNIVFGDSLNQNLGVIGPRDGKMVFRAKISGNGLHCVVSEIGADNSGVIKFYTQYITGDYAAPGPVNGNITIQWELVETITAPSTFTSCAKVN